MPQARGSLTSFLESFPMWVRVVALSGTLFGAGMVAQEQADLIRQTPAVVSGLREEVARLEGQMGEVRRECSVSRINEARILAIEEAICAPLAVREGGLDRDRRCYAIRLRRPPASNPTDR